MIQDVLDQHLPRAEQEPDAAQRVADNPHAGIPELVSLIGSEHADRLAVSYAAEALIRQRDCSHNFTWGVRDKSLCTVFCRYCRMVIARDIDVVTAEIGVDYLNSRV